jgi:hypothetical protein
MVIQSQKTDDYTSGELTALEKLKTSGFDIDLSTSKNFWGIESTEASFDTFWKSEEEIVEELSSIIESLYAR